MEPTNSHHKKDTDLVDNEIFCLMSKKKLRLQTTRETGPKSNWEPVKVDITHLFF